MAVYKFDEFQIQINAPTISIYRHQDNRDGTCIISVLLSLGAAPANTQFLIELHGFTYTGGQPTYAEMQTWALAELIQYEV